MSEHDAAGRFSEESVKKVKELLNRDERLDDASQELRILEYEAVGDKMLIGIADFYRETDRAHTAGFEAGLKARMPSETRIEVEAITRFGNPTMTSPEGIHWCRYKDAFKQGVAWLAANMRKGDVDGI